MLELPNHTSLAVPSWVAPGGIADNAYFLAGRAAEVGLCFFETATCLAYGEKDLPGSLAELPFTWHVHLPLDLPWQDGAAAAEAALALMDKVAFLHARRAVVHLPEGLAQAKASAAGVRSWEDFVTRWQDSGRDSRDILLENQPGDEPRILLDLAQSYGAGLCLDFSHWLMSRGPEVPPDQAFLQRVGLMHLNAPGPMGTGHSALTELSTAERAWSSSVVRKLFAGPAQNSARTPQDNTLIMLEIFSWEKIVASLPLLQAWLLEI